MAGLSININAISAVVAIVLATTAALLAAAGDQGGPLAGAWFVPALVGGITALAAFVHTPTKTE